mmetsp:Transcript_12603/g.14181  ORF Transcript_12603/g.14181 Transcript_12603/m.14181 type:complete len:193 (-) Transcript_12603:101-679(-)
MLKKTKSSCINSKTIDLTQCVNPGGNEKEPLKRWNRTDDKHLWKIIRTVSLDMNIDLENVVKEIASNDQSSHWAKILPVLKSQVESFSQSQTLDQVDKKGMKFFIKRVIKLDAMRDVSRREHKLIRKLLRSNKEDININWESILFHFPGKRVAELKKYTFENFPKYFQGEDIGNCSVSQEDIRSLNSTEVQN